MKRMKSFNVLFGLFFLWALLSCTNDKRDNFSQFNGIWRLVKVESINNDADLWTYDSAFTGWNGLILYDGHGHMGVQITPKGYQDFNPEKNIDTLNNARLAELVKFYQSNWVYFAEYQISGNTVEHKRLSATNPKDWGTVLTRDFEFRGDTLLLTAHETPGGKKSRLFWVKY